MLTFIFGSVGMFVGEMQKRMRLKRDNNDVGEFDDGPLHRTPTVCSEHPVLKWMTCTQRFTVTLLCTTPLTSFVFISSRSHINPHATSNQVRFATPPKREGIDSHHSIIMPPVPISNHHGGKKPGAGGGAIHIERRTWDIETYEQKAIDRRKQEESGEVSNEASNNNGNGDVEAKPEFRKAAEGAAGPQGSKRAFLQARTDKIRDLDERVGSKVEVILEDAVAKKDGSGVVKKVGVGWHCSVCNCMLKDSHAYLDHINGRRHLKQLGFSMRVERSTETDLMEKLSQLKKKKQQKEEGKEKEDIVSFDELVKEKDEAEQKRIEERRRKRKERRNRNKQQTGGDDAADADEEVTEQAVEHGQEEAEVEEEQEEEEEEEGANSMAALMGFSGFGGSNRA
jgi:U4/U6.U5 tri-snRNP component SNU23